MRWTIFMLLVSAVLFSGCTPKETPSEPESPAPEATEPGDQASHAAAASATAFLNALAGGDADAALASLTPLAAEQMTKNGKSFAFAALDKADFKITKVWQPKPDEAAVEYHMQAVAGQEQVEFDLCCFMKNVSGDWRLAGIAYDLGDGQKPVIVNYESMAPPEPAATQTVESGAAAAAAPHTAQAPAAGPTR